MTKKNKATIQKPKEQRKSVSTSYSDEESQKPYHWDEAVRDFNASHMAELKRTQSKFKGDWWQLAFLTKNINEDASIPNIKLEERFKDWNNWRKSELHEYQTGLWERIHLEGIVLRGNVCLDGIHLDYSHLEKAIFDGIPSGKEYVTCCNAHFWRSHIEGAEFKYVCFNGATLDSVYLDEKTQIRYAKIDTKTYIANTNLNVAKIDDATKSKFKYSSRRLHWEKWYVDHHQYLPNIVAARLFWACSDYGYRTTRILAVFTMLAALFGGVYFAFGVVEDGLNHTSYNSDTGIVQNLFCQAGCATCNDGGTQLDWPTVILRAVYFSVVTMTTLGFGDIYAVADKPWGHILLTAQVLLGYVLLGVLITRLSVLFNTEGPTYISDTSLAHRAEQKNFMLNLGLIYFWGIPITLYVMLAVYAILREVFVCFL
jgi:hypothetical protein